MVKMLADDRTADVALPGEKAIADAAKLIQAASGVEETRFNNLNSRAIALLSASSLVTSLAGLFSKEILTTSLGDARPIVAICLIVVLVCLVATSAILVVRVLLPNRRATFGDNVLTTDPGALTTPEEVHEVAFKDYVEIHKSLVERNSAKASGLHLAYLIFLLGVLAIALSVAVVAYRAT